MGLLGAHMSIAGGLHRALERGEELGCEAIQIFSQSGRTWKSSPLTEEEIQQFKNARTRARHIQSIIAHNSYLLNLSTSNSELRKKSVDYFITVLERCEALGIDGLVTHPGSHLGAGEDKGIAKTSNSLDEVMKACSGFKTKILLENTAGQGDCVGCTFEHLAQIVEGTRDPDRIGFCFDTQHAFAAGYDLRTKKGYEETFKNFDKQLGLKRIHAFHLNDALKDLGSRVDRHENIGKGFLGTEAFRPLVNDPRFKKIPMCLETDPGEDDEKHRADLATLRLLLKKAH